MNKPTLAWVLANNSSTLTVSSKRFATSFASNGEAKCFVAVTKKSYVVTVRSLVQGLSSQLANAIPSTLKIDLAEVLIGYYQGSSGASGQWLVRLGLGSSTIDLSNLPLISNLSSNLQVGVNRVDGILSSSELSTAALGLLNGALHKANKTAPALPKTQPLPGGLLFLAAVKLGPKTLNLSLLAAKAPSQSPPQSQPPQAKWTPVQATLGPLHVKRLALAWDRKKGAVEILLDAGFLMSALTIDIQGLGFAFNPPTSSSGLHPELLMPTGLEVTYKNPSLEISGGLAHSASLNEYVGELIVQSEDLNLTAMGAYGTVGGHPSLFIFAMLNDPPLGGPPFFYVTGVAAGFGFNSKLNAPKTAGGVKNFVLVKGALPAAQGNPLAGHSKADPAGILKIIQGQQPPPLAMEYGEYWIGLGLRFTTFKFVQSFALLTLSFGNELEIDLLGRSAISVPPDSSEILAYAELDILARIQPMATGNDPVFAIDGKLTPNSFLLSHDCRLTGGFAFYIWSSGEFVVTLGGYHPRFARPSYYPQVPRIGINWRVDDHLAIRGDTYFALTPAALMAGCGVSANWHSGMIKAWFDASADFLIYWHPFHFIADVHIHLGASFHVHILFVSVTLTVHIGADLSIWGPPFGGTAHIDLDVISFTVSFGADRGSPSYVDWATFESKFLPHDASTGATQVCGAKATAGLLRESTTYGWILNPHELTLRTHTVAPATTASLLQSDQSTVDQSLDSDFQGSTWQTSIGIPPMNVSSITSAHGICFERRNDSDDWVDDNSTAYQRLEFTPVFGASPAALWKSSQPDQLQDTVINETLIGVEIKPKALKPDQTQSIPLQKLLTAVATIEGYQNYLSGVSVTRDLSQPISKVSSTIQSSSAIAARTGMLQALQGIGMPVDGESDLNLTHLASSTSSALMEPPVFKQPG